MFKVFESSGQKERLPLIKPVVLLVLDGFGLAPDSAGNAITRAATPNFDRYWSTYPHGELIASGESVGLPANEVGNSEVGHLTLGAGRVIYQHLKRINVSIEDGTFFENTAFLQAASHVKNFNSRLHIMGLVGSGNVHSSLGHFYALLEFCKKNDLKNVFLHLFTDGRDTPPQEALALIDKIEKHLEEVKTGKIATISGRYYAMDRDRRWERTEKAYKAIVLGQGAVARSATDAVKAAYGKGLTDEFIEPTVIVKSFLPASTVEGAPPPQEPSAVPVATVSDNDSVIFFNFRIDRPRQLSMAFVLPDFESLKTFEFGYVPGEGKHERKVKIGTTFEREKRPENLFFVTMTKYHNALPVSAVAFGPLIIQRPLPVVLAEKGLRQLHLTESEKERMVTYYFDGLREEKLPGEDVSIVPSLKVETYDKKPKMSVFKIVKQFKKELAKNTYHFFVLNFANADMVAHSGGIKATLKAIEAVDKAMGELTEEVKKVDGWVFITADHGNAEELLTYPSGTFFFTTEEGEVNTDHSNNPVPFIVIHPSLEGDARKLPRSSLKDVATTILAIMRIPKPEVMTGLNLLSAK